MYLFNNLVEEQKKIYLTSEISREIEIFIEQKISNYTKKRVSEDNDEPKFVELSKEANERFLKKLKNIIPGDVIDNDVTPDVTPQGYEKKMSYIIQHRTIEKNLQKYYEELQYYKKFFAEDKKILMEVILGLLLVRVDLGRQQSSSFMSSELWRQNFKDLETLLEYWRDNSEINLRNFRSDDQSLVKFENRVSIFQTIGNGIVRLEQELEKAFHHIDYNNKEYSNKITQLYELLRLAKICQDYIDLEPETYKNDKSVEEIYISLSMVRLQNTYFLNDDLYERLRLRIPKTSSQAPQTSDQCYEEHNSQERIQKLYLSVINSDRDKTQKLQATLHLIYHHAIHDRFDQARDILLMSHAQEQIKHTKLQCHFNRALVQIGLAAFRLGKVKEANRYLKDIFQENKTKVRDLLQQNYSKSFDQIEATRKNNLPYHQHINIEFAETVYHIVGMLIEIPEIVGESQGYSNIKSKQKINTNFKHLLESFQLTKYQ